VAHDGRLTGRRALLSRHESAAEDPRGHRPQTEDTQKAPARFDDDREDAATPTLRGFIRSCAAPRRRGQTMARRGDNYSFRSWRSPSEPVQGASTRGQSRFGTAGCVLGRLWRTPLPRDGLLLRGWFKQRLSPAPRGDLAGPAFEDSADIAKGGREV
jgi:hypothetical protein